MKYLPSPYGGGHAGLAVSITGPFDRCTALAKIAQEFGCPPSICQRLRLSIKFSERYDCWLGGGSQSFFKIKEQMNLIGADIVYIDVPTREYRELINMAPRYRLAYEKRSIGNGLYGWFACRG